MTITVKESTWIIWFHHDRERNCTVCLVADTTNPRNVLMSGTAKRSKHDQFCKRVGRKVNLTKAIRNLDKAVRAVVWAKYFELMPRDRR